MLMLKIQKHYGHHYMQLHFKSMERYNTLKLSSAKLQFFFQIHTRWSGKNIKNNLRLRKAKE